MLEDRINKKREIYNIYKEGFKGLPIKMMEELENSFCTFWLSTCTVEDTRVSSLEIIKALENANIESRPVWKPMHMQPVYKNSKFFSHVEEECISQNLFERGICLPSDTKMTKEQQERVIEVIKGCFKNV